MQQAGTHRVRETRAAPGSSSYHNALPSVREYTEARLGWSGPVLGMGWRRRARALCHV
jgi:hypothetical protein